jgi:hypothetical protein
MNPARRNREPLDDLHDAFVRDLLNAWSNFGGKEIIKKLEPAQLCELVSKVITERH